MRLYQFHFLNPFQPPLQQFSEPLICDLRRLVEVNEIVLFCAQHCSAQVAKAIPKDCPESSLVEATMESLRLPF